MAAGSKRRLGDDRVVIDSIVGDVVGKRAIVLDDEIATGGSIVELMDKLAEQGVSEAAVACTHGLFAGKAVDKLRGHPLISEVVTTDTVPAPSAWPELKVRSVSKLFAEAITRIHEGESISSLFDGSTHPRAPTPALPLRSGGRMTRLLPVLADAALVLLFAFLGRRSHEHGSPSPACSRRRTLPVRNGGRLAARRRLTDLHRGPSPSGSSWSRRRSWSAWVCALSSPRVWPGPSCSWPRPYSPVLLLGWRAIAGLVGA